MKRDRVRSIAALATATATCGLALVGGCIIADSPGDLPTLGLYPPMIINEVPPQGPILTNFPGEFVISVALVDPSQKILWRAFTDFDPTTGSTVAGTGESDPDPASADAGVRTLEMSITPPDDLSACHSIMIIVAYSFRDDFAGNPAFATPGAGGSDSVTWLYAPTGSSNCPEFDAGVGSDGASE